MFIVFDLDGTLTDDSHRHHLITGDTKDWDGYYKQCAGDAVVKPIREIFRSFANQEATTLGNIRVKAHNVEIWTGRSVAVKEQTQMWLYYHGIVPSVLRMRPEDDYRRDTELKREWLEECKTPPDLVFDDRTRSVEWWRAQGIICCQVAQHDY